MSKQFICISTKPIFNIKVLGHNFFTFYDHYLMTFNLQECNDSSLASWVAVEEIDPDNISDCANAEFSVDRMKKYLKNCKFASGWLFYDKKTHVPIGFFWIMRRGGDEFQYRVRNVEAFFFDVYVNADYRGHGVCGLMFQYAFRLLKKEGISVAALGVRTNNCSAIKAYHKNGGKIVKRMPFMQLLGHINIPYYKV